MTLEGKHSRVRIVEYDAFHHRVWILGQRCHHGATGSVIAALACVGLIVGSGKPVPGSSSVLAVAAAGGALLAAHDWNDRSVWFQRGRGSQI